MNIIITEDMIKRFLIKLIMSATNDCIFFNGAHWAGGYARFFLGKNQPVTETGAHRVAWMIEHNAQIPEGYHIHHTCHNPACVNPDHLIALTAEDHAALHAVDGDELPYHLNAYAPSAPTSDAGVVYEDF